MNNRVINIACSADENFAESLLVMLTSLQMNTSAVCDVYILDGGLSAKTQEFINTLFLNSNLRIKIVPVSDECLPKDLKVSKDIPISSYYRLLLPDLLCMEIKKIIYLDSDLLVEGDIEELWNIPLDEYSVMAVPEMSNLARFVSSSKGLLAYKELGIPENNKYFNAGVLVINLGKWRDDHISERIFNYLDEYSDYVLWHDQDGLNSILWNKWKELPSEWNVMTALFIPESVYPHLKEEISYKYILNNIKILHYTNSKDKPWKSSCRHPLKERYYYYRNHIKKYN